MLSGVGATVRVIVALAELKLALPAWVAVMVVVPAPVICIKPPEVMVATAVLELLARTTVRFDVARAEILKSGAPYVLAMGESMPGKDIVCDALATVMLFVTWVAAL